MRFLYDFGAQETQAPSELLNLDPLQIFYPDLRRLPERRSVLSAGQRAPPLNISGLGYAERLAP